MISGAGKRNKKHARLANLRIVFISGTITIMLGVAMITAIAGLAAIRPFLPGSPFFPVQAGCEEAGGWAYAPGAARARYYFDLLQTRIDDLEERIGTRHELAAVIALETALDRAIEEMGNVPQDQAGELWRRLQGLAQQAENGLARLTISADAEAVLVVQEKLYRLGYPATSVNPAEQQGGGWQALSNRGTAGRSNGRVANGGRNLPGGMIPFPPGSPGASHTFYNLTGKHTPLACTTCHTQGVYRGVSNACEDCHAVVKPANHYLGTCEACHTPTSWREVIFDHFAAGATDCLNCHSKDSPANHYNGQCSNCHAVRGWRGAIFNHSGYTDCVQCHGGDAPANHYYGQCSQCHSTAGWRGAIFNHSGYTNCQSCHTVDAPNNHYNGQCSQCHSTVSWRGASFNHAVFTDCVACHAGDAPRDHYSGQCSQCHNQTNWREANFNHSGQNDCIACHLKDLPQDHDSGQCSECHNTSKWDD